MKLWKLPALVAPLALLGVSCSTTSKQPLEVRVTKLRTIKPEGTDDPMVRGEQQRILYGAIGINEESARRGEYYTAYWRDASGPETVRVLFEYHQGSSGSRIKHSELSFAGSKKSGKAHFDIKGDDYVKNGLILDWRCTLYRGNRQIASRHSYLWR